MFDAVEDPETQDSLIDDSRESVIASFSGVPQEVRGMIVELWSHGCTPTEITGKINVFGRIAGWEFSRTDVINTVNRYLKDHPEAKQMREIATVQLFDEGRKLMRNQIKEEKGAYINLALEKRHEFLDSSDETLTRMVGLLEAEMDAQEPDPGRISSLTSSIERMLKMVDNMSGLQLMKRANETELIEGIKAKFKGGEENGDSMKMVIGREIE